MKFYLKEKALINLSLLRMMKNFKKGARQCIMQERGNSRIKPLQKI